MNEQHINIYTSVSAMLYLQMLVENNGIFFFSMEDFYGGEISIRRWGSSSWTLWSQQKWSWGMTLVVLWLRLSLPMQGVWIRSLIKELRSHTPRGQKNPNIKKKKKQRNEAEKHKHLSKGNFDIQVKSFRPKDTSCFFKHSLLVAFRGTKVHLETKLWKITKTAALSQYFPNIILRENNIITKAAIIQLHCLCRWLLGPDFPFHQSPVTQSMLLCLSNNFLKNKNCWKMKFKTACKLSYAEKSSSTGP